MESYPSATSKLANSVSITWTRITRTNGLKSIFPSKGSTFRIGFKKGATIASSVLRIGWYGDIKKDRIAWTITMKIRVLASTWIRVIKNAILRLYRVFLFQSLLPVSHYGCPNPHQGCTFLNSNFIILAGSH